MNWEYILSKDKNNYLIWEELLLMCNEMGDTTLYVSAWNRSYKVFSGTTLPYALSGIALMMQKTIRRSFAFVWKKALR